MIAKSCRWKSISYLLLPTACTTVFFFAAPGISTGSPLSSSAVMTSVSLKTDSRLERYVTIRAMEIPLNELLAKLSRKDLLLSADPSFDGQKLQIRLKRRSLCSTMQSLAQLLSGTWEPREDKSGYIFRMSKQMISYRSRWWDLFLGEWERAKSVQRLAVLKQLRATPYIRKPDDPNPEGSDLALEAQDVEHQRFFNLLPATLQESIASRMIDFALFTGYFTHGVDEGAVTVPLGSLPESAQEIVTKENTPFLQHFNVYPEDVTVIIANVGTLVETSLALPNGIVGDTNINLAVKPLPGTELLPLEHPGLVSVVRRMGKAAPPAWQQLAAYQKSRVWPNDPPAVKNPSVHPPPRRADVLDWLGDKADMEFIADYYSRPCRPLMPDEKERPLDHPLKQELDAFAIEQDSSWKQTTDSIYLIRDNRWYRDDFLEVPSSLLQRWQAQLVAFLAGTKKGKTPPIHVPLEYVKSQMDLEAEVATTLTPWQISRGLAWAAVQMESAPARPNDSAISGPPPTPAVAKVITIFPFSTMAERILKEINTARFYASLTDAQRIALVEGQLFARTLTSSQQEQAAYLQPMLRELAGRQAARLGLQTRHPGFSLGGQGSLDTGFDVHLVVVPPSNTAD